MRLVQDVKVAAVQMGSKLGAKAENTEKIIEWTRRAAEEGTELICFPELSVTGYWKDDRVFDIAENVPGQSTEKLAKVAEELGVFICAGIAEKEKSIVYNAQFLVGPDGYIGKYRKTHMPDGEYPFYAVGYQIPVFNLRKCKVGISTCYDNRHPELPRILALKGAEIILMPHAWTCKKIKNEGGFHWETAEERRETIMRFIPSRAYDNRVFVIYLDQAGVVSEDVRFPGKSLILDPEGRVITESQGEGEQILYAILKGRDLEEIRSLRAGRSHFTLRLRRPELYKPLSEYPAYWVENL